MKIQIAAGAIAMLLATGIAGATTTPQQREEHVDQINDQHTAQWRAAHAAEIQRANALRVAQWRAAHAAQIQRENAARVAAARGERTEKH